MDEVVEVIVGALHLLARDQANRTIMNNHPMQPPPPVETKDRCHCPR